MSDNTVCRLVSTYVDVCPSIIVPYCEWLGKTVQGDPSVTCQKFLSFRQKLLVCNTHTHTYEGTHLQSSGVVCGDRHHAVVSAEAGKMHEPLPVALRQNIVQEFLRIASPFRPCQMRQHSAFHANEHIGEKLRRRDSYRRQQRGQRFWGLQCLR